MAEDNEEFLTTPELADLLKVTVRTLDQWAYERRGPDYAKVGRGRRYLRSDVDAWIESRIIRHQAG